MENEKPVSMPKKACMITIMFPPVTDEAAVVIKHAIDEILADLKEKRVTFQIVET
jgi:hypothetical protein